jgi:hypothetical protein
MRAVLKADHGIQLYRKTLSQDRRDWRRLRRFNKRTEGSGDLQLEFGVVANGAKRQS